MYFFISSPLLKCKMQNAKCKMNVAVVKADLYMKQQHMHPGNDTHCHCEEHGPKPCDVAISRKKVTKPKIVFENDRKNAIAFCAIGQPHQFYSFLKQFYNVVETIDFSDHHKYSKKDIEKMIEIAKKNNTNTFITTQKDETKLYDLIKDIKEYSFNVLELENIIE